MRRLFKFHVGSCHILHWSWSSLRSHPTQIPTKHFRSIWIRSSPKSARFSASCSTLSAEGELTFELAASADQQPTHGRCCTSSTELRLLSFFVARAVRKAGQISRIFLEKYSGKSWWWRFIADSSYKWRWDFLKPCFGRSVLALRLSESKLQLLLRPNSLLRGSKVACI